MDTVCADTTLSTCLRDAVSNHKPFCDGGISYSLDPFKHLSVKGLLKKSEEVDAIESSVRKIKFKQKTSDLFNFYQSSDLIKSENLPAVLHEFVCFLTTTMKPWLEKIFGVALNDVIDLFASMYSKTDHLLCHDDKLDSRKFAFIYYVVDETWNDSDGGCLNLLSCDGNMSPNEVRKSITPARNLFVLFQVVPGSYHEVTEVLSSKKRLALSGWFHTTPLDRSSDPLSKPIDVPSLKPELCDMAIIEGSISQQYICGGSNVRDVRRTFKEESMIELNSFFTPSWLRTIADTLKESCFQNSGESLVFGRLKCLDRQSEAFGTLSEILSSEQMFALLSQLTGLSLHEDITFVDSDDDSTDESGSDLNNIGDGSPKVCLQVRELATGTYSLLYDKIEQKNCLEFHFFLFPDSHAPANSKAKRKKRASEWVEDYGGYTVYVDEEGTELQRVVPKEDVVTILYTDSETRSFLKYVNCLACENNRRCFHVYGKYYE